MKMVNKIRVALAVLVIVCVILATSFVAAAQNYQSIIQEQNNQIEAQDTEIRNLEGKMDFYKSMILGFIDAGKLANDSEEEAFFAPYVEEIVNWKDPNKLETIIFHVCNKSETETFGHIQNVSQGCKMITDGFAPVQVIFSPEFEGDLNFSARLYWLKEYFAGKGICFSVFQGGTERGLDPNVKLDIPEIRQARENSDVRMIMFDEIVSWYVERKQEFPKPYVREILSYCRNESLPVVMTEWKISEDVRQTLKDAIAGYEDIVTVLYQTNNQFNQPITGFTYASLFENWGASIQPWYWTQRHSESSVWDMPPSLMAQHAIIARNLGAEIIEFEGYWYFFDNNDVPLEGVKAVWEAL